MDESKRIEFKQLMFVYSLEEASNPVDLMVTIPDVFVDKKISTTESSKILKGDTTLIKNVNLPQFSKYYVSKNYLHLNVISNFGGFSNIVGPLINASGSTLNIASSKPTNYPIEVGIGNVKVGDRLLAVFINNNPNGIIIARC